MHNALKLSPGLAGHQLFSQPPFAGSHRLPPNMWSEEDTDIGGRAFLSESTVTQKGILSCSGEHSQRTLSAELSFKICVQKVLHSFRKQIPIHQITYSPAENNRGVAPEELVSAHPDSLSEQVYSVYAMSQGSWKRWLVGHVISADRRSQAEWLKTLPHDLKFELNFLALTT